MNSRDAVAVTVATTVTPPQAHSPDPRRAYGGAVSQSVTVVMTDACQRRVCG